MSKYYDDALQAAYMCKEFGIKYENNAGYIKKGEPFSIIKFLGLYPEQGGFGLQIARDIRCRYYIHEDSLPIFEPMVGDITTQDGLKEVGAIVDGVVYDANYDGCIIYKFDAWKIIQRDNKAFFTPMEQTDG